MVLVNMVPQEMLTVRRQLQLPWPARCWGCRLPGRIRSPWVRTRVRGRSCSRGCCRAERLSCCPTFCYTSLNSQNSGGLTTVGFIVFWFFCFGLKLCTTNSVGNDSHKGFFGLDMIKINMKTTDHRCLNRIIKFDRTNTSGILKKNA